ncbi:RNA polymerase sigma-I factor [Tepidibacillus infernus]|uniref:RNA polymerase sigma-I factor n=1 Tax=Tepidibacillus TaxID=1494427 RepID=UPI00085548A4|nr:MULTISPECIES: RNA polymerase sigma-I factor [Tepidibacillus]GBF10210.1 RNA polymerase sigma factor SigI [Tepidibacillus sp. HK-1]
MIFNIFLGIRNQAQSKKNRRKINLDEQVQMVQAGDLELRNRLLKEYQPFILSESSAVCKRYIHQEMDEFSIALSAFNEAMDSFNHKQNTSFLSFAKMVIKRRLVDYIRKESRFQKQIPITTFEVEDEENQIINPIEMRQAIDNYQEKEIKEQRKDEMLRYIQEIEKYGITLHDLVEVSPKHADSRMQLFKIADILIEDQNMVQYLLEKKSLPIKDLLLKVEVSRKTIERNRKYIIALALIKIHDFHYLKEYLQTAK